MTNAEITLNAQCRSYSVILHFSVSRWLVEIFAWVLANVLVFFTASAAEPIDETKLPPAASGNVDFDRDIKPIFEANCYRCHGPERPKSHFRLDNRDAALKGGDNGVDIIPGNSAKSPLVHYIARLVSDMEMPPPGKGEPLSSEEVAKVRAWIDQGAVWGGTNVLPALAFSATPSLRWIGVNGDKAKFREIEGMREGFGGGVEHFAIHEQLGPDKTVSAEGRVLFPDRDFLIKLTLKKTDLGFVSGGFEQWRKYYDDTGGFYRPFAIPQFNLDRDLHLDIGRAWVDFGLTLPNWPEIVVGYEYQFKEGEKSMLSWGNVGGKNIYPSAKDIDEQTHILKLDLTHDISGWHMEDSARIEFYSQKNLQRDLLTFAPDTFAEHREGGTHIQGMNSLRLEREVNENWLLTGGYLYSRFDGDASFNLTTLDAMGVPTIGQFWSSDVILLKRESQVFSLATLFQPIEGLSVSGGLQAEWQRQEGAGNIQLDQGDPNVPDTFETIPATLRSDLDKSDVMEDVGVRYTKIPFTVLFAEARFEQETIGQFEQEDTSSVAPSVGGAYAFLRDTDATNDRRDGRFGFNTSPWRWVSLSAHYRNRLSDSEYDHRLDLAVDPISGALLHNPGYSAFIRHRQIDTDETETKLVFRPASWLRATFTYQWLSSDYSTRTDPVPGGTRPEGLLAGTQESHRYGFGLSVSPIQRLHFAGTFTYSDSRTGTADFASNLVVPYKGDIYSVLADASYTLNPETILHCTYSFSQADYGQNNFDSVPLGLTYTRHGLLAGISRRLSANVTSTLRYGFYRYEEPSSGGFNDYTAHGVFATVALKWP
jgi:mono/diheme cytochrome c family protein